MRRRVSSWIRGVAGAVAILLGLTLAAPPSWAGQAAAAPAGAKTLRAATDAKLASLDTSKGVQFAQAGGATAGSSESKPFFKTSKGLAVAGLMVGGFAWMIASRQSDNVVHSPAR